jgi:hypothetical protein
MDRLVSDKKPELTESLSKAEVVPLATARTHYAPVNEEQRQLDSKINRKMDIFLVGVLAFDFMVQGIDRTNAGFAAASSSTS